MSATAQAIEMSRVLPRILVHLSLALIARYLLDACCSLARGSRSVLALRTAEWIALGMLEAVCSQGPRGCGLVGFECRRVVGASFGEEVVERDWFVAVGTWCARAEAGAEGVAVAATLGSEVAGSAVRALVNDRVPCGFHGHDRGGVPVSPCSLSARVGAVAAASGRVE